MPRSSQTPSRRDDLLLMLLHGGAASNAIAKYVTDTFEAEVETKLRAEIAADFEAALLKTTDGDDVYDDFAIPASEIRRILAELREGGDES